MCALCVYLYLQITNEHYQHRYVDTLCVIVDVFVFVYIYICKLHTSIISTAMCVHFVCNCRCTETSLSSQFKRLLPSLLIRLHIVHCTWHQPNSWETFIFCTKCDQSKIFDKLFFFLCVQYFKVWQSFRVSTRCVLQSLATVYKLLDLWINHAQNVLSRDQAIHNTDQF